MPQINTNARIHLNKCPKYCNDVRDIFMQLRHLNPKITGTKGVISIIVPGNAGKPGGGHGTSIHNIIEDNKPNARKSIHLRPHLRSHILNQRPQYDLLIRGTPILPSISMSTEYHANSLLYTYPDSIILRDMDNEKKFPLEEQIIRKWLKPTWLLNIHTANQVYKTTIAYKWGLLYDKSGKTIQNIDYTSTKMSAEEKYAFCHVVNNINLDNTRVDLLFTFAPNFYNGGINEKGNPIRPTMYYTCEPPSNNTLEYKKLALKTSIMKCLEMARPGYVLIPYLGGGVNKCFLVPDKFHEQFLDLKSNYLELSEEKKAMYSLLDKYARNEYYELIEEICYEVAASNMKNKFLSIYVMLQ